jgi:ATP-dependent helicase/nuclease subunit A
MSEAIDRAREVQRQAADPERSVVLEASAGSGKTKVLIDRFLRLCLAGPGVDPRAVLAITFTRKATVEIMERLQSAATQLARLPVAERHLALAAILGREPRPAELERAAWFHEQLLADPSGLGIDTLHAFCQKVLGRFAADVGLDPRFTVLDERQELDYRTAALDRLELAIGRDPDRATRYVKLGGSAGGARDRVASLFWRRVHVQRWLDRIATPPVSPADSLQRPLAPLADALADDLQRLACDGTPWQDHDDLDLARVAAPLRSALQDLLGAGLDGVRDADADEGFTRGFLAQEAAIRAAAASALEHLARDPADVPAAVAITTSALLTSDGRKLRAFNGRKSSKGQRQAAFAAAAAPVLALAQLPDLADLLVRNRQLLRFGLEALDHYAELKRRDGVVDFQDLEYLALRLLTDPEVGPQVHYRLDAHLDHLLLDEFQDTNRNQWELLEPLLLELLAGGDRPRSVFVVGDVKQSIYGFRGADPTVFHRARDLIARQAGAGSVMRLPTNFRSLPHLVETVGDLCEHDPLRELLGAEAARARQEAARTVEPGEVILVAPLAADEERSGHERAARAVVDLVSRVQAGELRTWSWDPQAGRDQPRPMRLDDVLILARTKTHLATYETALRRAGIPYTPAGRGLLARSREVQDVLALLRWLTVTADDTAGATALRSPAFRLPEAVVQDLLRRRLAPHRRTLRDVLRQDAAALGLDDVATQLGGWFGAAGLLPLHDLLRRIMREGDLLARFEIAGGEQARYNLLRLLDLALAADQRGGSLRDFVVELEQADRLGGEDEGPLPGEGGEGRVRVMTVHGAKGLEAPLVILADAASPLNDETDHLPLAAGEVDGPYLAGAARTLTDGIDTGTGDTLPGPLAPARRRALSGVMTEEAHVLYVALTRARDQLVVLGGLPRRPNASVADRSHLGWLQQATEPTLWDTADTLAMEAGPAPDPAVPARLQERAGRIVARCRRWDPPPLAPRLTVENPSQIEDDDRRREAAALAEPGPAPDIHGPRRRDTAATRRGERIHRWLERAARAGAMPPPPPAVDERADWQEARTVFEADALQWLMAPDPVRVHALCEAPVSAVLDDRERSPRRMLGVIDRLLIAPDRIDIVDYKSNRVGPGDLERLVAHYRPQLAAYRDALRRLYPDREIRGWLVWTGLVAAGSADGLTEVVW